jgi:uncharacterized protein with von Willebrand factor type A (vWA) domain
MRRALSRFADLLRQEGLRVSSAELIDAGAALQTIDIADRDALRDVLRITLAKRYDEIARLDRAFDRFFAPPAWRPSRRRRRKRRDPTGEGEGRGPAGQGQPRPQPIPPRDAARGLVRQRQARLRTLGPGDRHPTSNPPYPCPVIQPPSRAGDHEMGRTPPGLGTRPGLEQLMSRHRPIARKPFRERWSAPETERLAEEVTRTLARLRVRRVRRRRVARRGTLWVQRLIRQNLGHDGVPFRLVRHRPKRREPHLLLLVDVSHSVARAAAAFLTLTTHLARSFRRITVHFFVDRAVEVTADLPTLYRLGGRVEALTELIDRYPDLNPLALSDYGRVLYQVVEAEERHARKDTLCLILGDARTNHFDPAAWTLETLGERCRRVIWLIPEPRREWDTGDSAVAAYAEHSDALCEVGDLDGLRYALGQLFGR